MLFSGKITHSFLVYLGRAGVDLEGLWEHESWPTELLKDPSCWIHASVVEEFLTFLDREYGPKVSQGPLVTTVGRDAETLRAWGVLDSVLRLMTKVEDVYWGPERILSYFVSPAPPIANLMRGQDSVSFELPISAQEFPLVIEYLRAALESLPTYAGRPQAQVQWSGNRVQIAWSANQPSLLGEDDLRVNARPEFVQSLVRALEAAQTQLEATMMRNLELEELVKKPANTSALPSEFDERLNQVEQNVTHLLDYLTRSHQLVQLLVRQGREDHQVREAMKRVDWDHVSKKSEPLVREALKTLKELRQARPVTHTPAAREALDRLQPHKGSKERLAKVGPAPQNKLEKFSHHSRSQPDQPLLGSGIILAEEDFLSSQNGDEVRASGGGHSSNLNEAVNAALAEIGVVASNGLDESNGRGGDLTSGGLQQAYFMDRPVRSTPGALRTALVDFFGQIQQLSVNRQIIQVSTRPVGRAAEVEVIAQLPPTLPNQDEFLLKSQKWQVQVHRGPHDRASFRLRVPIN